jgi:hypothetical protein
MAPPDLGFDFRNLPAATGDSCCRLPFPGDLLEAATVAVELGLLAAECLPALQCFGCVSACLSAVVPLALD